MRAILFTAAIAFAVCLHGVNYTQSDDLINFSNYGNCTVFDARDVITDELEYALTCETVDGNKNINFFVEPNANLLSDIMIQTGAYFRENEVLTHLRIDRNTPITKLFETGGGNRAEFAFLTGDIETFKALLIEIATGARLAIRAENTTAIIPLEGSYEAVADYLQRIEHLLPETTILPIQD